ncbi:hypothetical protein [Fulvivirga sp.]|uniref:VPS10 domain-containing protein n=1 Tax=Fulvivirga sp. TaxID=1931237 RepID=UPI0032EB6ABD
MNNYTKSGMLLGMLMFFCFTLKAQKVDMSVFKGMTPRSIGPAGMSGRVTAIDAVDDNKDIIYVGTASGGLWKSINGGISFNPVFDKEKVMSIGAVAIQQNNPDVVWAGTGEGNPRNSLNGGFGIYKSYDGGKSWKLMGLEKTRHIHRIVIDPLNPNTVYVGAIGSPWGEHPERGVFKTTDGGETWTKVLFVDNKTGAADLVMDPTNPNKLFAAMWEHRRKPWTFTSGGPGSGLYVTVDGGENWKKLTEDDGFPKGDLGRIGVAVAPSNPNRVYALVESNKNGLYRSDDGGYTWSLMSNKGNEIGNRPFYYSEIYVDPVNDNRLYTIFTYVNVSNDGGKNFSQLMDAYGTNKGIHPDHHSFYINPKDPNFIIEGNDGGLNISRDRGVSWRFVENLPLAQFYHINVDMDYPYNVYGGMQDNGSWAGPAYVWKSQGIRNSYWQEISFGDGFDVVPDPDNSRYGYTMSQEGSLSVYDKETGHNRFAQPTHPDPDMRLRFNWNAAIAQDPFNNSTVYYGSQFVHKSTNKGKTWEVISPDLTTNDPEKQKQYESGGLTMDATGAENNTTILAIAPSPVQKDIIWVGTDDGYVQITRDGGKSWTNVTSKIPGMPKAGWVAQITASTYNAGEAFVIVNNYRNFDYQPYLFHTTDFGNTWTNMVSESQVWNYTLSFIQDPLEPKLMFLGSEGGLYVSFDGGANWNKWEEGYSSVPTMDMAIHPREHDLVIGTYGRAAYVLDDIRPLRAIAKQGTNSVKNTLDLYDTPDAYITLNQQPSGTRFGADAIFNGENRNRGAMITYLVNKPEKKKEDAKPEEGKGKKGKKNTSVEVKTEDVKKDEVKYDSVILTIYNSKNELIRTLKSEVPKESGVHRMYWRLDEKGVNGPSRRVPEKNAPERSGSTVLPGQYKLKMAFGDKVDSTMITVKYDPRVNMTMAVLKAQYDFDKKIEASSEKAGKATARLAESKEILEDFTKRMKEKDEEGFKELIDKSKAAIDSINSLFEPFVGKDNSGKQGIIGEKQPSIQDRIRAASYYAGSALYEPGDTENRLLQQANLKLDEAIKKVDAFFETQWKPLREELEKADLSPFKEYEPLDN